MHDTIFCIKYTEKGVNIVAENKKNIVLRVTPDFHQQIKIYVTMNNTTLQDYIVGLIKKDMKQNKKE